MPDMPEGQARSIVGCVLASAFGVATPVAWVAINGLIALAFSEAPPSSTWIDLPVLGVLVGVLAGLLPIKFRAPRWIPWIAVGLVLAGVAIALWFCRTS